MSKKVYILGAGSSVHVNGPLNTDWIERIKKNNENLEKEKTAIDFLNGLPGFNNLEVLLSLIDLSIIEQHNYLPLSCSIDYLKNTRTRIIECIVNVANEITEKAQKDSLISDFFKKIKLQEGDTVINFNYDLAFDWGLYKTGLWNPYKGVRENTCGYGFGITSLDGKSEKNALKKITPSKVKYLKLHGSINWLEQNTLIDLKWNIFDPQEIPQTSIVYPAPPANFIITPSFIKTFEAMPLRMLWRCVHESISQAAEVYIIGYSFPQADVLARQLLLYSGPSIVEKIIVVDPLSDSCSNIDKREDIISMLPWRSEDDFWIDRIEIITKPLEQFTLEQP